MLHVYVSIRIEKSLKEKNKKGPSLCVFMPFPTTIIGAATLTKSWKQTIRLTYDEFQHGWPADRSLQI